MRREKAAVAAALCFFLAVLAAFPAYCDFCTYRFVSAALAPVPDPPGGAGAPLPAPPPCCVPSDSSRAARGEGSGTGDTGKVAHARIPFCLTGTLLTSLATPLDVPLLVRRPPTATRLPGTDTAAVPGRDAAAPHQPRAPPA